MTISDSRTWMWFDAVEVLTRAERLHRQTFRPMAGRSQGPSWEPPVDVLETEREVLVLAALPGVDPDRIQVVIDNGTLRISGERVLPPQLRTAVIHRLELPQGRFERQLALPPGQYEVAQPSTVNGCLVVILHKLA
jgi:HSP20 family protein